MPSTWPARWRCSTRHRSCTTISVVPSCGPMHHRCRRGWRRRRRAARLTRYADQLALAFQIMDDVRDVEGGPALGKDAGGDLDRRVPTWPVIEWLAMRPGSREMWLSEQTSSAELQTDLVHSGATKVARAVAVQAAETAWQ